MARHNYWFYLLAVCSTLMIYLCLNQAVSNGKDTEALSAIQLETELIEHDRVETLRAAETRALGILGHGFAEEGLIKPFINYTNNFLVASDVKLIYCPIQKSMSQLGSNIMCFLYNEQQFLARNQSFTDVIYVQKNYCLNYQDFVNPTEKLRNHADTARFTFIRDPFDRFLSFYLDKCVNHYECYDCGKDMRCVVRRLYEGLQQIQRKDGNENYMYAETHASLLSWYCNFKNDIEKWELIKIGADKEKREAAIPQLVRILKKQEIPRFPPKVYGAAERYCIYQSFYFIYIFYFLKLPFGRKFRIKFVLNSSDAVCSQIFARRMQDELKDDQGIDIIANKESREQFKKIHSVLL